MCYQILEAKKVIFQDADFDIVKQRLSDLIELDKKVSDSKWERTQLLTSNELPFKAGKYTIATGEWRE